MAVRAVPDVPVRAIGYVRVSDEGGRGDDLMSPAIQLAAIRDHCQRRGYQLVRVLEDIDLSGRFWKRRQMEQAIAEIEQGTASVVVVWKVSRVSRNRLDWAVAVDRVEAAGGALESATEPVDAATSTGRFTRGVLAELAAFESDRIGESWRETHRQRFQTGLRPNGRLPWGWVRDGRGITPDPVTGPLVGELYRRFLAGEGTPSLARWLTRSGYPTQQGGRWAASTVRSILDNPVHAGFTTYRGDTQPGAHAPLIDAVTWERYQAARRDTRNRGRRASSTYLLSGLARCGWCGNTMVGHPGNARRWPLYHCWTASSTSGHQYRYIRTDVPEQAVMVWLAGLAADVDALPVEPPSVQQVDRVLLESRITDIDRRMATLTRHLVSGLVPESAYRTTRDDLARDRAAITAELTAVSDRQTLAGSFEEAAGVLAEWEAMTVPERRAALRHAITQVTIWPGPDKRVEVVPIWTT